MELQKIKQLIDLLAASDLGEIELVEGEHRIRLVKRMRGADCLHPATPTSPDVRPPHPSAHGSPPDQAAAAAAITTPAADTGDVVTAPLFGIVHLGPAPNAPAFVNPGDTVGSGQTLCVVEAMKMFHEVKADRVARVVAILAGAGQEVDAGAPLIRLAAAE